MKNGQTSRFLVTSAVIAALYGGLTLALSPISYGIMQLRFSEGLTVLSLYTPAAFPGLTVGCFIANLLGPGGITDAFFGSLATLIGCLGIWLCRRHPWFALMINVVSNAVIIGLELRYVFSLEMSPFVCMGWIGLGELISCYVPAVPLKKFLDRRGHDLHFY